MDAETKYIGELKGLYANLTATKTSDLQWPPPCTHKVFNLAMIKEEPVKRSNVSDSFVRMTITGKLDDILHVKTPIELENIFNGVRPNKRKVVLMEGAPGCGKSTLANFISQQWGEDKIFANLNFKVVILVRLRDPVIQKAKSISDLFPSGDDITVAKKAEESMRASKYEDVLLILDGWDELPKGLREDSIFRKLIQDDQAEKHGLDNSAVIVTSRPVASGDLHKIISTRVEILGFTPEELQNYFRECLEGDFKAVETLLQRIEENPEIAGTCYLPLNASILVHLFKHSRGSNLPTSQYGIFSLLVCTCISRHLKERTLHRNLTLETLDQLVDTDIVKEPFRFLCDLAYDGVMNDRITFSSLPENTDTLSILQGVESFVKHDDKIKSYNFIHLSIQELLAAFYMMKWLPPEEQVAKFDKLFDNPRFNAVFQFYSAMTKLRTPGIGDILTKVAEQCSEQNPEDDVKILLVALFHCLNAAQDPSLCELIMKYLQHGLNLGHTTLNPTDCLCIGYFLSCACNISIGTISDSKFKAKLFNCDMGDKGCKYLVRGLEKHMTKSDRAVTKLYMDLKWSNLHKEGSFELSKLLQYDCVNAFNLNGNEKLSDQGTFHIAEKLKTNTSLTELQLYTCGLTAQGVCHIAGALTVNNSLKTLNLGGNEIKNEGVDYLASALRINHSLKSLELSSCGMTDEGLKHITNSLQCNKSLEELKLYNFQNQKHLNEITVDGDAMDCLIDTIGKTSVLQSLVLPKEFEKSLSDIQESVNEERKFQNLAGIIKIEVKGQTFKAIKGIEESDEEMEVETGQSSETEQMEVSITGRSESLDIIEVKKLSNTESHGIQKSKAFREAEQKAEIPFVHHGILECDYSGLQYTNSDHDISIIVPEGAVSEGDVVHFEFGVTIFGPFKFVGSAQPISPITWVCLLEENYELQKPYQVILPHMLTQLSSERLQHHQVKVAKAKHKFFSDDEESKTYEFRPCGIEPIFGFTGYKSYAVFTSMHFCFYCLEAKHTLELAEEAGYCLVTVESPPNEIYFLAMYFLPTCLKSLEQQFPPELRNKICGHQLFKFKSDTEPYIRIKISPEHHQVVAMEPTNSEIKASDIDFWSNKYDKMHLKHKMKMYPPRVKMTILSLPDNGSNKLPIKFEGCLSVTQSLDFELKVPLAEHANLKSSQPRRRSRERICFYQPLCGRSLIMVKKRKGERRKRIKSVPAGYVHAVPWKYSWMKLGKSASMDDAEMYADAAIYEMQPRRMHDYHNSLQIARLIGGASISTTNMPTIDLAQPNLGNLRIIIWINKNGKEEKFRFLQSICNKWRIIGDLLNVPNSLLDEWKNIQNPIDRIHLVLNHWLCNPDDAPPYCVSWKGLYQLLIDAQLSEIVPRLKEALENAKSTSTAQAVQQMSQDIISTVSSVPENFLIPSDDEHVFKETSSDSSDSTSIDSPVEKDSSVLSSDKKPAIGSPMVSINVAALESSSSGQAKLGPSPRDEYPPTPVVAPYLGKNIRFSQINLVKWKNDKGEFQRFHLMEEISHKWRDIGILLDFPHSKLESTSIKYRDDPKECCRAIVANWFENPPPDYPTTWQGLIDLLEDCQLSQVVDQLRNVLTKLYQ